MKITLRGSSPRLSLAAPLGPYVIAAFDWFAAAFVAAGIYGGGWAVLRYITSRRSFTWPSTTGRIVVSEVREGFEEVAGKHMYMHSPQIIYRYEVDGLQHESAELDAVTVSSSSRDAAEAATRKYPVGSEIEVFYDPARPSKSIVAGARMSAGLLIVALLFSALFIYVPFSPLWPPAKQKPSRQPPPALERETR